MPRQVCRCGRALVRSANETCQRCWKKLAKEAVMEVVYEQLELFGEK